MENVGRLNCIFDMIGYKQTSDHFMFQKLITQEYPVSIRFDMSEY